ncbi:MAG: HD-GYP domain-containing protein [Oscillospiraceae bacterium]|nr:HD-GYP domain-containing protein [Oscillospiraceae bacterium]
MRFVSIGDLEPGMVLGRSFIGALGELMLAADMVLTEGLVEAIKNLNYSGLYIKDSFSEGIEPDDLISHELRNNSVRAIRRFMLDIQTSVTSQASGQIDDIGALVERIVDEIINSDGAMVNLIDLKSFDLYTFQHSVNVCVLSCAMGAAQGLPRPRLYDLALAAILHDIGKVFVPIDILNKPGALTDTEFDTVKKHPAYGSDYVRSKFSFDNKVCMPIKQHHERHDGGGYPMNLGGDEISPYARIIAIADVYDAIMSKRPYHEAVLPSEAYEYIMGNSGTHFNPDTVSTFVRTVLPFPIGVSVRLSNGMVGLVYKNNPSFPLRPLIKIREEAGMPERFIDLSKDSGALDVTIQAFL